MNAGDPANEVALTVCDLTKAPVDYSEKSVRLKGPLVFGRHGAWLIDPSCPTVQVGGFNWTSAVSIGKSRSPGADDPIEFAFRLWNRSEVSGKPAEFHAVVVGQLHVVQRFDHVVVDSKSGLALGTGFGAMKMHAFWIGIDRVEFLSFREAAAPDHQGKSGSYTYDGAALTLRLLLQTPRLAFGTRSSRKGEPSVNTSQS
jgi:hypothetical protein